MKQGFAVPKEDGRGKHGNYPHKFQDEAVQSVREFLNTIPKYNSHYSRQQNPNKVYLDCDLTISSCLLKYLEITNPQTKHLHIITDNCKGQAKNWTIIALERSLVATKRFDSVQHYFPEVDHTMLPCDRDFGRTERYARNRRPIVYTPDEWAEVIKSASPKHFIVTKMEREDFRSLESLKTLISKHTEPTSGDPHHFSEATQFKFESEDPFKLSVKHYYQA
ncbi:uncharacterized protein LOC126162462 [Schistocerca cancellata]|uniref:uncharacterized protein LOC126162462 n=1 Tax=Schistocerca cancellata TaxID=274614 RepID=UPI00211815C9|nr:uncharacterized protein LOC126162462 [Schistocerca cancellata]